MIHPSGWDRYDRGEFHELIPVDDTYSHEAGKSWCPCKPKVITIDEDTGKPFPQGGYILSHNAFDGRD